MDIIHSLFKDALGAVNPIPKIQEKWTMIRGNQNLKNCAVGHEATYEDRDKNWTKLEPFEKSIEIGNKIADLMTRDETIKSDDDATLRYLCDVGFISLLVDSPLTESPC